MGMNYFSPYEYISPSPELIEQWYRDARNQDNFHVYIYIAKQAARWGFNQISSERGLEAPGRPLEGVGGMFPYL
jgi:hypothetical protein